jgi:hypothetical protein
MLIYYDDASSVVRYFASFYANVVFIHPNHYVDLVNVLAKGNVKELQFWATFDYSERNLIKQTFHQKNINKSHLKHISLLTPTIPIKSRCSKLPQKFAMLSRSRSEIPRIAAKINFLRFLQF